MTRGELVVAQAEKYLGVRETRENSSPTIDAWQHRWGMGAGTNVGPQPWCGMFQDAMFAEAGVDDHNICHPSTAEIVRRAKAAGYIWNGKGSIPAGALWVKDGVHSATVVKDYGNGVVKTIDGNSGNMVRYNNRGIRGFGIYIVIIPGIEIEDKPVQKYETRYYIEDVKANPYVYRLPNGKVPQWATKRPAEKTVEAFGKDPKFAARHPRVVKLGNGNYAIQMGGFKDLGPWLNEQKRNRLYTNLLRKYGPGRFRKYSKQFKVKG